MSSTFIDARPCHRPRCWFYVPPPFTWWLNVVLNEPSNWSSSMADATRASVSPLGFGVLAARDGPPPRFEPNAELRPAAKSMRPMPAPATPGWLTLTLCTVMRLPRVGAPSLLPTPPPRRLCPPSSVTRTTTLTPRNLASRPSNKNEPNERTNSHPPRRRERRDRVPPALAVAWELPLGVRAESCVPVFFFLREGEGKAD